MREKKIESIIRHPHNIFLELKASFGIIGFGLILFSLLQGIGCLYKKNAHDVPLNIALLVYGGVLWSSYLSFFKDPWFLAWIGLILAWHYHIQQIKH